MGQVRYEEDRRGIAELFRAPWLVAELRRRAELGRIEAERIAPVDTGAYAYGLPGRKDVHGGGFKVDVGVRDGHAFAELSNDVHRGGYCYAIALEWGFRTRNGRHVDGQRIFGRVIDHMAR